MSKLFGFLAVAVLLSAVVAGCGGKLDDSYVQTTLKDAARGDVVSPSFKYSFDTPNMIGSANNVALVREGNIIEFFVGDGLAEKAKQVAGKKFVVHARKYFTPYIHFMVDYIVAGSDTIRVGEVAVQLPNTRPAAQFAAPEEYETVDTGKLSPSLPDLRAIVDTKFKVDGAGISWEQVGDRWSYSLNFKNVRFFIDESNDAMLAVMNAIMNEGKTFAGGVQYTSTPTSLSREFRERLRSGGNVKVGYIIYGGNALLISM
jgi:hypothetical protein